MPEIDFDGRVIVVTGAGRGLGAAYALALAKRGARVLVNDLGVDIDGSGVLDERPAEAVTAMIREQGGEAVANFDSVADSAGADAIVVRAVEAFGRLDGIVHNAGITAIGTIDAISDGQWAQMLAVHLSGAFFLTRAAWPHLSRDAGRILYISSGGAFYGLAGMTHYAAAKSGLLGLSRAVAAEGAAVGIHANLLAAGGSTRLTEAVMASAPEQRRWHARYMKPELPAAAAVWLLHPDCPSAGRAYQAYGPHVAEVFVGETTGFTELEFTPENLRDHWTDLEDRDGFWVPDGVDDFHARSNGFIVDAGADPPPGSRSDAVDSMP
jgi:NAD(P)-dependent dehydrogenase (short-subunit alcohol dehydrogenase family)